MKRSPLSRGSKGLKRSRKLRQDADSKYWRAVAKRLAAAGVTEIDPTQPMPWHVHQFAYKPLRKKKLAKVGARAKREEPQLRAAKKLVRERSGGWCEVQGCERRGQDYHHLKRRSRGGKHTAENLVHWCRFHHDREHFG